jgi:hypothetical protein
MYVKEQNWSNKVDQKPFMVTWGSPLPLVSPPDTRCWPFFFFLLLCRLSTLSGENQFLTVIIRIKERLREDVNPQAYN